MKKPDLGQIITILANMGVIAGIIFLGIELNQGATIMRAQTRDQVATEVIGLLANIGNNQQLASVIRRAELERT